MPTVLEGFDPWSDSWIDSWRDSCHGFGSDPDPIEGCPVVPRPYLVDRVYELGRRDCRIEGCPVVPRHRQVDQDEATYQKEGFGGDPDPIEGCPVVPRQGPVDRVPELGRLRRRIEGCPVVPRQGPVDRVPELGRLRRLRGLVDELDEATFLPF